MVCTNCDGAAVFARGLCQACYTRLRRNGSVERKYVINTGVCGAEGCGKPSFSKNLCKLHYDQARHPLANLWRTIRSRNPGAYPEAWDRFDAFLSTVGERPSARHQLRRLDPTKPYAVDNVEWLEPVLAKDCYTPEDRARYERAWRLQRKFGITVEDYDKLLNEQGGVCAICKQPPEQVHRKSGKLRDLAVDHDHGTGQVRGLLCADCNMALGLFSDSPDLMRKAAAFLDHHRNPRASFRPMTPEPFEAVERRAREALGDAA